MLWGTQVAKFWVQQRSERVVSEFITVLWCSVVHCVHYGGWTSLHKQQNIPHATEMGQQQKLEPGQNQLLHYVSDSILFMFAVIVI